MSSQNSYQYLLKQESFASVMSSLTKEEGQQQMQTSQNAEMSYSIQSSPEVMNNNRRR